ncbi:unnamed protein product [Schistosoma curassoni]|uniref:Reverse transcriptase domain-containing protein n=1 Tax=Schistosoma curassoni TaxID=6186 RepID=A0A183KTL9_9TREM|nr:unnamed protein product [Schistosoma curassoni]
MSSCGHLVIPALNCTISGILSRHTNSNTSNHHVGVTIESNLRHLDINLSEDDFEDYMDRFEMWCVTRKYVKDNKFTADFLTFIDKEAYSLLKNLAFPEKPFSLSYGSLKGLLINHVKCAGFERRKWSKSHKMMRINDQKVVDSILELQKQVAGRSNSRLFNNSFHSRGNMKIDSAKNFVAGYRVEYRNGKCLSCGKLHYDKMGHIKSVCKATVHVAASNTKLCSSDSINFGDFNNHILSLFTTSSNSLHIQKRSYLSSGAFHDFIVDTGSIKSIMSVGKSMLLNPYAIIMPTKVYFEYYWS